jgi:hypothetical protein
MKKSTLLAIMLAGIFVVGAQSAPYCIFKHDTTSLFIKDNRVVQSGNVWFLKPDAIFNFEPKAPAGVLIKEAWLIDMYQHPDSIILLDDKNALRQYFWSKVIPKYRNGVILTGKYFKDDTVPCEIKWRNDFGSEKISWSLIFAMTLLLFTATSAGITKDKTADEIFAVISGAAIFVASLLLAKMHNLGNVLPAWQWISMIILGLSAMATSHQGKISSILSFVSSLLLIVFIALAINSLLFFLIFSTIVTAIFAGLKKSKINMPLD